MWEAYALKAGLGASTAAVSTRRPKSNSSRPSSSRASASSADASLYKTARHVTRRPVQNMGSQNTTSTSSLCHIFPKHNAPERVLGWLKREVTHRDPRSSDSLRSAMEESWSAVPWETVFSSVEEGTSWYCQPVMSAYMAV